MSMISELHVKAMRLYEQTRCKYPTYPAAQALREAKQRVMVQAEWDTAEGAGLVRLRVEPDETCNLDDLLGDCYNPEVNPDIRSERLAQERQREIDRIKRDGVWGVIGEYKCPSCGEWAHGDSCWGFVGDDWHGSGCDVDIMAETLEALLTAQTKG